MKRHALTPVLIAAALFAYDSQSVFADYALVQFPGSISRYSNTGEHVLDFQVYDEDWGGYSTWLGESVEGITVGPDGFVYATINNLGAAYVQRFDPRNGLGETIVQPDPFSEVSYGDLNFYSAPTRLHFGPHGDIYGVSIREIESIVPTLGAWQYRVFRVDSQSGATLEILQGAVVAQPPYTGATSIVDLASRTGNNSPYGGELFVATNNGILQRHYQILATPIVTPPPPPPPPCPDWWPDWFPCPPSPPPPPPPPTPDNFETIDTGIERIGAIEFGPDGLLYIMDRANQSIVRYDVDARSIVDTFIDDYFAVTGIMSHGDIYFGPENSLILQQVSYPEGYLSRFDALTGDYLGSVVPDFRSSEFGRDENWGLQIDPWGVYIPIPEPNTISLLLIALPAGAFVLGRRRWLAR